MGVILFGAHGKVGQLVCSKLKSAVTAVVRSDAQAATIEKLGAKPLVLSLEGPSIDDLTSHIKGHDAVVFSAGSGGKGGQDGTLAIDLDGAVKTFEAAHAAGVKRYIIVSAWRADERAVWYGTSLRGYYIAKKYADQVLRTTSLDYTILQPAALLDGQGTGKVHDPKSAVESGQPQKIYRDDVAEVIAHLVANPTKLIRQTVPLINGDLDIKSAL